MGGLSIKGDNSEQLDLWLTSDEIILEWWGDNDLHKIKPVAHTDFIAMLKSKYFGGKL